MTIRVESAHLSSALAAVKPAVDRKASIPILNTVKLEGENGRMRLAASNIDIMIETWIPYEGDAFGFCAPVYMLDGLCRAGAEVSMEPDEQSRFLRCRSGKARFSSAVMPASEFPEGFSVDGEAWNIPAAELKRLLGSTSEAAEPPESARYYLAGAHLTLDDGRLTAVATDGKLMCVAHAEISDAPELPANIIVPGRACGEIIRICERALEAGDQETVSLRISDRNISVEAEGARMASKLIDGSYPQWKAICTPAAANVVDIDCGELAAAISRVSMVPGDRNKPGDPSGVVGLVGGDGCLSVGVITADAAIDDEIVAEVDGVWPDVFLKIDNLKPLIASLKSGGMERIRMTVSNEQGGPPIRLFHSLSDRWHGAIYQVPRPHTWPRPEPVKSKKETKS